jgi:hypothetical protein
MSKTCTQCGIEKAFGEFHRHPKFKDGRKSKCKSCVSINFKNYYARKGENLREYSRTYYMANKDKVMKRNSAYYMARKHSDIQFRLACNLRSRLSKALSQNTKVSSIAHLGCSMQELRFHIEHQFVNGMTWDNYGKWHVDHIFPLSKVDLTNENELKRVVHFSNLQPLWRKDNQMKSNKEIVCR